MNELLGLFINNLLPIFLIAGVGAVFARFTPIDPRSLSQIILHIFSPCLIFTLLTQSKVENELFFRVVLFCVISIFLLGGLAWMIGKILKMDRPILSSMMLTTMFSNAGNYGLPVVLFAFGQSALGFASLFFVVNICLAYTAGTVIASMSSVSFTKAMLNLLKMPLVYALLLALLFLNTGWQIPLPLERATKLLGDATIPCMLLMLGFQIKSASLKGRVAPIALTTSLRLLAGPLLAVALLPLFGLTGAANQAIVVQSGMPSAVLTTMIATEYDAEPGFASAAVFVTTLLSPLTITPLLSLLGA